MNRLNDLRGKKATILQLAAKHGACNVRAFGSVARGEERSDSDLDVLVDFEPGCSLLDQVGFEQDLQDLLGCKVDVVVEGGIHPFLEPDILHDAVPL